MNEKTIKIIGIVATAVGMGATLVSSWVGEKATNNKIEKEVAKATTDKTK